MPARKHSVKSFGAPAKAGAKAKPGARKAKPIKVRKGEKVPVVLLSGGNPQIAKADGAIDADIVSAIGSTDPHDVSRGIIAAATSGAHHLLSLELLFKLTASEDVWLRRAACNCLGYLRPSVDKKRIPEVIDLLRRLTGDDEVREEADGALWYYTREPQP